MIMSYVQLEQFLKKKKQLIFNCILIFLCAIHICAKYNKGFLAPFINIIKIFFILLTNSIVTIKDKEEMCYNLSHRWDNNE